MQLKENETYYGDQKDIAALVDVFVQKGKELRAAPESAVIAAAQIAAICMIQTGMTTTRSENDNFIVHVVIEHKSGVMEA